MRAGTSPWGNDISVHGGRKLLAFSGRNRIVLMNVADPANPTLVSDTAVPKGKNTSGNAFSPDGTHLVAVHGGQFSVYDIGDASSPRLLQTFTEGGSEGALFHRGYLLVSGYGSGTGVWKIGRTPADLTRVQTLPCYFYNSKFWVEGDRVFTDSEGVDELILEEKATTSFLRGDVNGDGSPDLSDAVLLLFYLFLGEARPGCLDAADFDHGGTLQISDAIGLLGHLFLDGPPPPEPYGTCGLDRTPDSLDCGEAPAACG